MKKIVTFTLLILLISACSKKEKILGTWHHEIGYHLPGELETHKGKGYAITFFKDNIFSTTYLNNKTLKGYYRKTKLEILFWFDRDRFLAGSKPDEEWYNIKIIDNEINAIKRNGGPIHLIQP